VFLFRWCKFRPKEKFKINKKGDFGGLQSPEVRENNNKIHQIFIFDCHIFYTFQWMIANLAKNKNSLKINTGEYYKMNV
jgi:hypothetical protein